MTKPKARRETARAVQDHANITPAVALTVVEERLSDYNDARDDLHNWLPDWELAQSHYLGVVCVAHEALLCAVDAFGAACALQAVSSDRLARKCGKARS
jgi:hypothetical protein